MERRAANERELSATGLYHLVQLPDELHPGKKFPAVIMVHGRSGTADVMWPFAKLFRSLSPVILSPQASFSDPRGGFSWWDTWTPKEQESREARVAKIQLAVEKLKDFVNASSEVYPIDRERVVTVGFSQGASLIASAALKYPTLFSAVAILAGFVPSVVVEEPSFISNSLTSGEAELPPIFIAHGTRDEIVPLDRAQAAKSLFEKLGAQVEFHTDETGHKIGSAGSKALENWITRIAR